MKEIGLMKKSIHLFISLMVVNKRGFSSTAAFGPLVNRQVISNIRKLVSIVQVFGGKEYKPYLFYDCERPYVNSLE